MSWDAELNCDLPGPRVACPCWNRQWFWNYTHNTNPMISEAVRRSAYVIEPGRASWWKRLNGMEGPDGAKFLHEIITELESDPVRYEAMNPANGWGDYESLLGVLRDMRNAVPEWPCTWEVSG